MLTVLSPVIGVKGTVRGAYQICDVAMALEFVTGIAPRLGFRLSVCDVFCAA